jgi:hypothetical protein
LYLLWRKRQRRNSGFEIEERERGGRKEEQMF